VPALTHAVVCRRRRLHSNQISTIADGAFAGLTALLSLYGAGLWAGRGQFVFFVFFYFCLRAVRASAARLVSGLRCAIFLTLSVLHPPLRDLLPVRSSLFLSMSPSVFEIIH
jgi:hypothetical protein